MAARIFRMYIGLEHVHIPKTIDDKDLSRDSVYP